MDKTFPIYRRALTWLLLLILAEICSYKGIYESFIAPNLRGHATVPYWWWLIAISSMLVTLILAGCFIPTWFLAVCYSVGGAITTTSLQWLAALWHQPGLHKLIEGGLMHFLVQFLAVTILFMPIILSSHALATWLYRKPPSD